MILETWVCRIGLIILMGEGVEFADLSGVDGRFNGAELFGNIVKTFTLPNL